MESSTTSTKIDSNAANKHDFYLLCSICEQSWRRQIASNN